MSIRQQVGRPVGLPEYNRKWRIKWSSQQIANRVLRLNAWLPPYDDAITVAGVAMTEKTRTATFTESDL